MPIEDTGNISSFTLIFQLTTSNISSNNNMKMVINPIKDLFMKNSNNYNEVRNCILASNIHCFRTPSLFSSDCKENYAIRVQRESDRIVKDNPITPTDSLLLEYITLKNKDNQVSKIAKPLINSR